MNPSRLERLQRLLAPDIDALPDLPPEPEPEHAVEAGSEPCHTDDDAEDHHHSNQLRPPSIVDEQSNGLSSQLGCSELTADTNDKRDGEVTLCDGIQGQKDEEWIANDCGSGNDGDQIGKPDIPFLPNPEPDFEDYYSDAEDSEAGLDITIKRIYSADNGDEVDASCADEEHMGSPCQSKATNTAGLAMKPGQLCSSDDRFCPVLAVSKFPYRYLPRSESEQVADRFFNGGRFWSRGWDLFYVYEWENTFSKPLILITYTQFQALIKDINDFLPYLQIDINAAKWRDWLVLDFPQHPRLRPRYLGPSNAREEYDRLTNYVPSRHYRLPGESSDMAVGRPDDRSIEAFKALVEDAIELNKNKTKAAKAKRQAERILMNKNMQKQLKRTQRYLGLRAKCDQAVESDMDSDLPWAEKQRKIVERTIALTPPPLDINKTPPFSFEGDPIFIAIDVEAHELNRNAVTEVGVATLDTRDIRDLPPGPDGKNWRTSMRCRHFRIEEYRYHANSRFVNGCPGRFDFGDSEYVPLSDARHIIESCFKEPYSRAMGDEEVVASFDMASLSIAKPADGQKEKRSVVLVGHNPAADIDYLAKIGYNVLDLENLVETIDTASLWRAFRQEAQPTSLGNVLYHLDIAGWNLHNAGNDAAYSLQAMLAIAVRAATERGKTEAQVEREERERKQLAERVSEAVELVQDQKKEWSAAVDDEDDGGVPLRLGCSYTTHIPSKDGDDDVADPYHRSNRKKSSNRRSMKDRLVYGSRRDSIRNQMYPTEKKFYANEEGYTVTTDPNSSLTSIQGLADAQDPQEQIDADVDNHGTAQKERIVQKGISNSEELKAQFNTAEAADEQNATEEADDVPTEKHQGGTTALNGVQSPKMQDKAADAGSIAPEEDKAILEMTSRMNSAAAAAAA